ncbi:MAG TPA: S41 family peptidase [Thermomicrobiales bacterium]|nr:S41 family peptidase [Thermomicrobiales bacterium]
MTDRAPVSPRYRTEAVPARAAAVHRLVVSGLVVACIGAGVGIDRVLLESPEAGAQDGAGLTNVDTFQVLEETYDVIRESYVRSDDISDEDLIYGAAAGMVDALGDTGHSRFLTPEDAQRFMDNTSGELVGIGVNIDSSELPLRVIMPIQNSPALEAGIEAGDLIVGINGESLSEIDNVETALTKLRGEEGTNVTLTIEREGQANFDVEITRSRITIEPVSWAMMPGDVLWVRIDQFSAGTTDALVDALQQGKDRGAKGLLLDLRANPGGLVSEALGVAGQLQPGGNVLYQEENAAGAIEKVLVPEGDGLWQDLPIVVLIDGDSASAAEITASSLADNGRATLVGETTRGTGTVLLPTELSDGSFVLIGTELWLTANGEVIWHQGVEPTIDVEMDEAQMAELPYTFIDQQMPESSLTASGDAQLVAAHAQLLSALQP